MIIIIIVIIIIITYCTLQANMDRDLRSQPANFTVRSY